MICYAYHPSLTSANGMVLCASDASHERVEPLRPAEGAPVGQRVWFGEQGQDPQVRGGRLDVDAFTARRDTHVLRAKQGSHKGGRGPASV